MPLVTYGGAMPDDPRRYVLYVDDPEDAGRSGDSVGNITTKAVIARTNRDADAMVVARANVVAPSVRVLVVPSGQSPSDAS